LDIVVKMFILYVRAQLTLKEDGFKGLAKGWAPTFWGYAAQVSRKQRVTARIQPR
jgi:hypothetical protein